MTLLLGGFVIAAAIYAIYHKVEVRLALLLAGLALGALAGDVAAVVRKFFATFADEKYVVPICCAMGFAYVLKHTGCDQHLVHLLVRPLRRVRPLLIPGTVLVGFLVNIPVISQTSTAVTIGPVLIPLLSAARVSPVTSGAALLLGSSIGGELLNPGAPELQTVVEETRAALKTRNSSAAPLTPQDCVEHLLPLNLVCLGVATLIFWLVSLYAEARARREEEHAGDEPVPDGPEFRVSVLKALVPLVPLALLFLTTPAFGVVEVPRWWLLDAQAGSGD